MDDVSDAAIRSGEIKLTPINEIVPNPKNPNKHPPDQIERLSSLIKYQGFRNPLVVSERTGFLVVGHGRLEAAKKLGMEEVPVMTQWFKDEAMEYAYLVSDNAISEWAAMDLGQINSDFLDMGPELDVDMLGFKDFVIEPIEKLDPQCGEDEVPEAKGDPVTKRGDVWLLGNHRVMCGDSTMIDEVEILMPGGADITITSPPYNFNAQSHLTGNVAEFDKKYRSGGDDLSDDDYLSLLNGFTAIAIAKTRYSFVNLQLLTHNRLPLIQYQSDHAELLKDVLIWNKKTAPPNIVKGCFSTKFEYVFAFSDDRKTRGFPCSWQGKYPNVIETESNSANEHAGVHKAGFPVALPAWIIEKMDFAKSVYDPFCGTGTTAIAAESAGLTCYGMELDEHYCDVIVERWEKYTGKQATLESTGENYQEISNGGR